MVKENTNNNLIIKNEKSFETVQEIDSRYEIPSYEEFLKNYENDGKVNYEDLSGENVGDSKGYGPCKNSLCGCSCSSYDCSCSSTSLAIGGTGTSFSVHSRKWEKEKIKN